MVSGIKYPHFNAAAGIYEMASSVDERFKPEVSLSLRLVIRLGVVSYNKKMRTVLLLHRLCVNVAP